MTDLKTNIDYHIKNEIYPFHTPGHKQNYNFFDNTLKINDILKFDLTEIPTLDNLNDPKDVLLQLNKKFSKIFNSFESFLTVNGSTLGVICSILYSCKSSDFVLAGRNSHKSLFSGVTLANCSIQYLYPKMLKNDIAGYILAEDVEKAILENDKIKAVFITSPTYEGVLSDIKSISKITKKYNKILIVDEAHGAHFAFNDYFPTSAVKNGADIVIQSLHKTLPSLTQTSIIHISKDVNKDSITKYMYMLQTSSPSYIFMYAASKLVSDIENNALKFDAFICNVKLFRKNFNELVGVNKKITLLQSKQFVYDKSRLTFIVNANKSGKDIENILRNKFKIQIETSSVNHFIALTSVCDTKEGFTRLLHALIEIDKTLLYEDNSDNLSHLIDTEQKVQFNNSTWLHVSHCENLICDKDIIPYPPGIPFLLHGEVITKNHISKLQKMLNENIDVIGVDNNKIKVKKNM